MITLAHLTLAELGSGAALFLSGALAGAFLAVSLARGLRRRAR